MQSLALAARVVLGILLLIMASCAGNAGFESAAKTRREPTVIMLSLDGFRADYRSLASTPNLDRLATGVAAEALVPVFPAETFPNHYTLVTGLYPEHHGIVANSMWDSEFDAIYGASQDREETFKPRWWGGEPIWVTAARQGLRTASYFWVGTEAVIDGVQPDYWFPFDSSVPFEARVDQVLAWLDLPAAERPQWIGFYFSEPNGSGHRYGGTAPGTLAAVEAVDALVGRLITGLEARGLFETTNIVVVSDHGMADVAPERTITLEDTIDLDQVAFFTAGTSLQIFPRPGQEETIFAALDGAHPELTMYRKGDLPERFHFSDHRRIAPLVGVVGNGWLVDSRRGLESVTSGQLKGAHGYDPEHPEMLGLFIAHGPSFRTGVDLGKISAVDVYQLVAHALGIEPAPNDGDQELPSLVMNGH